MKKVVVTLVCVILTLGLFASQRKLAFVIGNANYESGSLRNSINDADSLSDILTHLGFDVTLKTNLDKRSFETNVNDFAGKIKTGDLILFYYSGHGIQLKGENYLWPVKAELRNEVDVEYEAISMNKIIDKLSQTGNTTLVVVLDACRDNPYSTSRSLNRGLALLNTDNLKNYLIAYATKPGSVSSDGNGVNGTYTTYLLENLRNPGFTLSEIFRTVKRDVMNATDGVQQPEFTDGLTPESDVVLVPRPELKQLSINQPLIPDTPKRSFMKRNWYWYTSGVVAIVGTGIALSNKKSESTSKDLPNAPGRPPE